MQTSSQQLLDLSRLDWNKGGGLIPAIVQNYNSGKVLMLGYMNAESLGETLKTELVTFYSRSKQRLWTKGETSGNVLKLVAISQDCDNDSLLVQVIPKGPSCHKGTESCWAKSDAHPFINKLEALIADRKHDKNTTSYTASLFDQGTKRIAQKVGEEGLETALAAVTNDKEELVNEASDLVYHLLVLLEDQQLTLADIHANLNIRNKKAK